MATPPGDGGNVPREGFYPDPSIPGYVRYWNGAAWVPGTSRPAPQDGEATPGTSPATPATSAPSAAVEETGPVFFDEDPPEGPRQEPRQEPASAWQADASRQTGFGGERDARVSWGAARPDPRVPGPAPEPARELPAPTPGDPTGGALPGVRALGPGSGAGPDSGAGAGSDFGSGSASGAGSGSGDGPPLTDGTVTIRALRRGVRPGSGEGAGAGSGTGGAEGPADPRRAPAPHEGGPGAVDSTMAIRALRAARRAKDEDAPAGATARSEGTTAPGVPAQGADGTGRVAERPRLPGPQHSPPAGGQHAPVSPGAGGGAASWAQQAHPLARPDQPDQPVVPWKPPVNDPFLQAAQAQANARPAALGKRFAARLIDTVVLGAIVGALAYPLVSRALAHIDDKIAVAERTGETVTVWLLDGTTGAYLGAALAALLIVGALYEALPTAKWGRTLGKKLCGLDVRDIESHEAPAFGAALRRWLVYGVLGVLVVGVVNVLWCLIDRPWRQCWHDKAARTFVSG
ncbi:MULTISPECIES: RDD family protein [unclassified Streptomyces]|uniref:RDD family protein n=1 Tax=unclassified Streptomyces TaxID=2593676 RepID=UPI003439A22B